MGNILEITDSRNLVDVSETSNTLEILAPNAIAITEVQDTIEITEAVPQVILQSPGPQGLIGLN